MIDFWFFRFALVETKETHKEKYIGRIRDDPDNYLYKHFCITALTVILKYYMLSIKILQRKMYEIIVVAFLHCILTFDLYENIK